MDAALVTKDCPNTGGFTMRITNKIMQNNSLYNINNNKITEDQLNTMMATGKKITRPSDDPVIAIRALRLRSNVTMLSQYYEKNAKDAESWLDVTADALSTVTSVLTDCVKQATKGANMDLTVEDMDTIVTQLEALADEYYSTGNVDFAGRYVFTGYRTDNPLTFDRTTSADYQDINDEFNASDITESNRLVGKQLLDSASILDETSAAILESDIKEMTVGRIRLSYDKLNYSENGAESDNTATLKWRESLDQPATSTVTTSINCFKLTYQTKDNITRNVSIPMEGKESYEVKCEDATYRIVKNKSGTYTINIDEDTGGTTSTIGLTAEGIVDPEMLTGNVAAAQTTTESRQVSTITYTGVSGNKTIVSLPLVPAIGQTYTMNLDVDGLVATINSDGSYTIEDKNYYENNNGTKSGNIIQVAGNGSIRSSYSETSLVIKNSNIIYSTTSEVDIDKAYSDIANNPTGAVAYLNAVTGEVLLNDELTRKLSTLPDIINAKTIDVEYDKKEWDSGDIKPENLFACTYTNSKGETILYNKGSNAHDIAYDVGLAQSVVVNTTADAVFTTDVKRNVDDLRKMIDSIKQVNSTLKTLKLKAETATGDYKTKLDAEVDAATKAYNLLRNEIQKEFEHKITSMQNCLDTANIAVTDNGTRSKRLELVTTRLMTQTTTFKTLKSENEDIDLAEAATQLTTAQVTYEASLMATGKISQASLMNYI